MTQTTNNPDHEAQAPEISFIIPTLNEAEGIEATLDALDISIAAAGLAAEIIIVDGGSTDGTTDRAAERAGLTQLTTAAGRGLQLNAGARHARAPWLFFLHADSHPAPNLVGGLADRLGGDPGTAYFFKLQYRNAHPYYRTMENGVEWRCRNLGLPYGDQGMCIHRGAFAGLGGFREDIDMEDLDFVLRLRRGGKFEPLPLGMLTSARQYEITGRFWGIAWNIARLSAGLVRYFVTGPHGPANGGQAFEFDQPPAAPPNPITRPR